MNNKSVKLTFELTAEQVGPFPVSTESLWCDIEEPGYKIKNIPFFIDKISFDDLVLVSEISDGLFKIDKIIRPSGNSTIWLCVENLDKGSIVLEKIKKMGCGVEGGVIENYFAINVPAEVNIGEVYDLIDDAEESKYIFCDYPSIRHK